MEEPKFKAGDTAEFKKREQSWDPVTIRSDALRWAAADAYEGTLYLVQGETGEPFLSLSTFLRRAERWEPCPKEHRTIDGVGMIFRHLERRVGSDT